MKKAPSLLALMAVLCSCSSFPPPYSTTVDDTYKDKAISVSLVSLAPADSASPEGFAVQCVNNGSSPVTVKWQKSTITLDAAAQPVFLEGQAPDDPRQPPPDSVIPAASLVKATLYPSKNVSSTSGAYGTRQLVVSPFFARQISLSICVEVGGEDRFYTIRVTMEPPATAPQSQHMSTR